ncbi:proline--tRNA ligase [Candidatus Woesearchaeota archaeon]|nr:proline--tRNA ligase [Candidatus Woesearchaeota archaeon]
MGITVKKADDFSEWYTQVIKKADLIDYGIVSGCMVIKPYGYAIWERIQAFLDSEFKKLGVKNAYFPMLIPESLLKKEQEHVEGFTPEVAWVTHAGESKLDERLAIRPTSETIMYDSYAKWIRSHRDLPLKINQWCNIIRWEFKHPMPFLRTREFLWQEGHTVFASRKEAEEEVLDILDLYARAFEEMYAVPVLKGTKSETEKFAGAVYTTSVETFMPNGKAIQGATSHFLGQNFSKAFDISFINQDEKRDFGWQNSWGFTTRSVGIMIAMHGDDKGLVLPPRIAPTQVVVVPILFSKNPEASEKVLSLARDVYSDLQKAGIRVELDDDAEKSPGFKFNSWELKGVPLRIEIGPKDVEKESVVFARRDTGTKESVPVTKAPAKVGELLGAIQKALFEKAKRFLQSKVVEAKDMYAVEKVIKDGGIALCSWCGSLECEEKAKDATGAKSLNIPFDKHAPKDPCFACKKESKHRIHFAKSY